MIDQAALADSFGKLDAGTRALLDLSLRRAIPDDQVAKVLGVDPTSIPPRRARGIAQLADMMEVPGPSELAALLIAIPDLPEEAWGVPTPVPFGGGVSLARRAKAFRRVAIAASPLVALGAVMAAVVVASVDHSGSGSQSGGEHGAAVGGAGAAASVAAPDSRHGLPPGVQLAHIRRSGPSQHRHGARHRRSHRHAAGTAEPAIVARQPAAVERSQPVAFHPAPVAPQEPRHVTHHHAPVKKHKTSPTPAPVQTPSAPVSTPTPDPVPTQDNTVAVPVSTQQQPTENSSPDPSSGKPYKTPPSSVNLTPPGHHSENHSGGGNCGDHHGDDFGSDDDSSDQGSSHHSWHHGSGESDESHGSDKSWSPPGLFRKHHGH